MSDCAREPSQPVALLVSTAQLGQARLLFDRLPVSISEVCNCNHAKRHFWGRSGIWGGLGAASELVCEVVLFPHVAPVAPVEVQRGVGAVAVKEDALRIAIHDGHLRLAEVATTLRRLFL